MKALISTYEPRATGYRVAEVLEDNLIFDVSPDLFWIDCADDVVADQFYYDPETGEILLIPPPPPSPKIPADIQPNTTGLQTA